MLRAGVVPNSVTFVSVLSACSHAGLIEEGRELFDIMRQVYKIDPLLEHYGCMIDLLGRGGLLEEAEALIADMNVEPDIVIRYIFVVYLFGVIYINFFTNIFGQTLGTLTKEYRQITWGTYYQKITLCLI
jgi:pentatricopeptide repeat protein